MHYEKRYCVFCSDLPGPQELQDGFCGLGEPRWGAHPSSQFAGSIDRFIGIGSTDKSIDTLPDSLTDSLMILLIHQVWPTVCDPWIAGSSVEGGGIQDFPSPYWKQHWLHPTCQVMESRGTRAHTASWAVCVLLDVVGCWDVVGCCWMLLDDVGCCRM